MGVPGLWDLIRPAATRTSLSTLARESFLNNHNGLRAFTIGIDASIWIFHAQVPQYGENPFLRTILFKITALLQHPVLPVFVFDGPNKPSRKRNERVGGAFGTSDWRSRKFKEMLDVCGLEWWNAPGEAEAELAVMNRQGKIDAVLSDDVDALLFGATCLLRNNSPTLSGAQASSTQNNAQRGDLRHYEMYRSTAIKDLWTAKDGSSLKTEEDCRLAMVLTALLGGGDYAPEGLAGFGPTITHGLAQAGYADFLRHYGTSRFSSERGEVVSSIINELRTNSTNHIGRKYPSRAKDLQGKDPTTLFPDFALEAYLNPATSPLQDPSQGWPGFGMGEPSSRRGKARNTGKGDMEGMARACEKYFEWGTKEIVGKKFASENVGIFAGQILNDAREGVWARTIRARSPSPPRTIPSEGSSRITSFFSQSAPTAGPSKAPAQSANFSSAIRKPPSHILKIHSTRKDPLNGDLTEYRVSYDPTHFVARCHSAMAGTRGDPKDLPLEERQRLGLVDKGAGAEEDESPPPLPSSTQAASAAVGKTELRVWIPEYLLQEAWPALLMAWEESRMVKIKSPKKKAKTVTKAAGVTAAETTRFRNFFTANPTAQPVSRAAAAKGSNGKAVESSTEEEVEAIEDERFVSPKKNTHPRPPTSSLSSSSAPSRSKSPPLLLPSSSASNGRQSTGTTRRSKSPVRAAWSGRSKSAASSKKSPSIAPSATSNSGAKEVIDLCSSSDEAPPARPTRQAASRTRATRILSASPKANLPASSSKPSTRAKAKTKEKGLVQAPLGLPVVAGPSRSSPKPRPLVAPVAVAAVAKATGRGKGRKVSMVVVYEDEDQEVIDSTRGVWRASQSPGLRRLRE